MWLKFLLQGSARDEQHGRLLIVVVIFGHLTLCFYLV